MKAGYSYYYMLYIIIIEYQRWAMAYVLKYDFVFYKLTKNDL